MTDKDIDYSDIPPLTDAQLTTLTVLYRTILSDKKNHLKMFCARFSVRNCER
jgi:hypothetical protein